MNFESHAFKLARAGLLLLALLQGSEAFSCSSWSSGSSRSGQNLQSARKMLNSPPIQRLRGGSGVQMTGATQDSGVKIGFLGLGIMGNPMALNLLRAGFDVTVWNRMSDKCKPLVEAGAKALSSPAEVVGECDITFAMVSDPAAAEAIAAGIGCGPGVYEGLSAGKGYIDCSTVSAECSTRIAAEVRKRGGMYLEAPVSGSKKPAEDGALIFLCGGDKELFDKAVPALEVMGKKNLFLGDVGSGAKMKLVVNMVMSSMLAAYSEGFALAEACGLEVSDVIDVVDNGAMACPMFKLKGPLMAKGNYNTAFPLKHAQKDLRLALLQGDEEGLSLPVSAAANEQFKLAKGHGHGDDDFSAVYSVFDKK